MKQKLLLTCCLILFFSSLASAKILFRSNRDGNYNIYVMNDDGSNLRKLTDNPMRNASPRWSSDGKQVVFHRNMNPGQNRHLGDLFIMDVNGGNERRITEHPEDDAKPAWSPDGKSLVFTSYRSGITWDIHVINLENGRIKRLTDNFRNDDGLASSPDWAPDGKRIAYRQNGNIYITDPNGRKKKPLLPLPPEENTVIFRMAPHWSPDGDYILFIERVHDLLPDGKILFNSAKLVIRHRSLDIQQDIEFPKGYHINSVCWMSDGREILFSAATSEAAYRQGFYEIYRYHLKSKKMTNLTNHPARDYEPHWISNTLSVLPFGKLTLQWGQLKRPE